jgi:dTDP-4-dehydrorhamnose reductase
MLLGAGGKMGPSLARLAQNALTAAGSGSKVHAVSRFSDAEAGRSLREAGVNTINADLMDDAQLAALPDVPNIVYLVARKFGTTGSEHLTWALNTYLPGRVAERFRAARIVAFSSGNVYPLSRVALGGSAEADPAGPVGEYAQSVLGRERMFTYGSLQHGTPVALLRLNYAIDLRYGVLLEVARAVRDGTPVDLRMGNANVIWQGDANEYALRALQHCSSPPRILNITGPETVSIRWLARRFGERLGVPPVFVHEEQDTALLNNAAQAHSLFGYPRVTLLQMIDWTAHWVARDGETHGKPSHFQEREGQF